jgi:hypothetical protein
VLVLDEPLPSATHLERIVRETFHAANLAEPERAKIDRAVDALIGLAAFPAEQVLAISLVKRELDTEDLWERKRQVIEQTPGVYQFQENSPTSRRRIMRDLEGPLTVMPPSNSEA